MYAARFGNQYSQPLLLEKSNDLLVVRTHPGSDPAALAVHQAIADADVLMQVGEHGVQVFKIPETGGSVGERKLALRREPAVRFAGRALVDPLTHASILYTENIFIKFVDDLSQYACEAFLAKEGLKIKAQVGYAKNSYFVSAGEGVGTRVFDQAQTLLDTSQVEYCHPELLRETKPRAIHPNQWHLKKTRVTYEFQIDASANVEAAHALSQGQSVVIAIIDDAIDIDHPDFSDPGKIVAPRNFGRSKSIDNPRPRSRHERHGTPAAGVACANGLHGASGVAPGARLMPIRVTGPLGSQAEANAFAWAADNGADVISCSWGGPEGHWAATADKKHQRVTPLPASTRLAIEYAVRHGRDGKGCNVFFAAGNGNESADNDGYVSHPDVIAVAACNEHSRRCNYSDFGRAIWCCFPSGDIQHPDPGFRSNNHQRPRTRGIWTTDLRGKKGDNTGEDGDLLGNYTDSFSGTSTSCAGAAGVAALILAINPELCHKQLRQILADCCDKIGHPADGKPGQYDEQGRSDYYGHGRLNALKAVRLAQERRPIDDPSCEAPIPAVQQGS